jgi:hypothetical protein
LASPYRAGGTKAPRQAQACELCSPPSTAGGPNNNKRGIDFFLKIVLLPFEFLEKKKYKKIAQPLFSVIITAALGFRKYNIKNIGSNTVFTNTY